MSTESIRIAEYLDALDHEASIKYCIANSIPVLEVLPYEFQNGDDVFNCLSLFLEKGIDLTVLFLCPDVWGLYLKDVTDPRYHIALDMLLAHGSPADLIMYFRACYRFGFPAMDDASFDVLERLYLQAFPSLSFLNEKVYDDDVYNSIVMDAVKMSGVRNTGKTVSISADVASNPVYTDLNTEKSRSIRPVVTDIEAFEFWKNAPMCRVHFSLKIDGVNTKVAISSEKDQGLQLALSRGRAADSIDYTEAIRRVFHYKGVDDKRLSGKIAGESFIGLKDLAIIQSRYPDKDYKTPKSTAMAMLRAPDNFLEEDYQYLRFYAFSYGDQFPSDAFRQLRECGLDTPPELEFDGEEIPRTSLEEFNLWMEEHVINPMNRASDNLGIGSDGVVMYLLADINTERKDRYSDSNIAIKYGPWGAASYTSVVKRIIFEQMRVEASIVLEIEPTVMRDKNTATRVGVGSPDILINDGVKVGDVISFERKSEAYNVYLNKV